MTHRNIRLVIRGTADHGLVQRLSKSFSKDPRITLESQQQDEQAREDALVSLFVVKPKQTGFTALAELRQAAMLNPENTGVLVAEPVGIGSVEGDKSLDDLLDELEGLGVDVFTDEDDVHEFIEKVTEQTGEYTDGME